MKNLPELKGVLTVMAGVAAIALLVAHRDKIPLIGDNLLQGVHDGFDG